MRKRKRIVCLQPLLLLLLSLLPLAGLLLFSTAEAVGGGTAAKNCLLKISADPTSEVEVLVTFKGGGSGVGGDPDPMQSRRFIPGGDYVIAARSLNTQTVIVRFVLGLLRHRGGGSDSADLGSLVQMPGQSDRRDDNCAAFYCTLSCQPRREIQFGWSAQSAEGAACVEVRALVTLEHDDLRWLRASAFLCRAPTSGARVRIFPAAPCCACGSANYLIRFHGAWDPAAAEAVQERKQQQLLSWSELLGTTHDDTYALWEFGGYSSGGVKKLCESGSSDLLEDEIKYFGDSSVLTVIKARDLPFGSRGGDDQTRSAIFTVNSTHHLVTFLSRPVPTPGWCVGLSMLDLCQVNCTWADQLTLELRPWDAGTEAGRRRQPKPADQRIAYLTAAAGAASVEPPVVNRTLAVVSLRRIPPRDSAGAGCGNFSGNSSGGG